MAKKSKILGVSEILYDENGQQIASICRSTKPSSAKQIIREMTKAGYCPVGVSDFCKISETLKNGGQVLIASKK
ncbi:MAG: hypothetical protein WCK37_01115 [Candidatus Falkowbacteria bacterium]